MRRKQAIWGLFFMLPGLAGFVLCVLIPVLFTLYYASVDGGGAFNIAGNIAGLFQSEAFIHALRNTSLYLVVGCGISIGLAIVFALLLFKLINDYPRLTMGLRTCYLLPLVIPSGISVLFVHMLFSDVGLINQLTGMQIDFLRTSPYTFWILVVVYIWKNLGYFTVIFLMAFAGIERDVYDAAKSDGCGELGTLFRITLPQITPSLFFVVIIGIVNVFKMSRESYLLFGDYPNQSAYMFQNFIKNNLSNLSFSRAASASFVLLLVFSLLVGFMVYLSEREDLA